MASFLKSRSKAKVMCDNNKLVTLRFGSGGDDSSDSPAPDDASFFGLRSSGSSSPWLSSGFLDISLLFFPINFPKQFFLYKEFSDFLVVKFWEF